MESSMDYETFCVKLVAHGTTNPMTKNIFSDASKLYHIVIHKMAFQCFIGYLDETVVVRYTSHLYKKDHVHLYAFSLYKKDHVHLYANSVEKFKFFQGIQIESIENPNHRSCILQNFFSSEERHNFVCNFNCSFDLLKGRTVKSILKQLDYLHDMTKLNLPERLKKELFQQHKCNYYLPERYRQTHDINYNNFSQVDYVHNKDFVVWIQNDFDLEIDCSFIVTIQFVLSDVNEMNMCLKCMQFEMENSGDYIRRYMLRSPRYFYPLAKKSFVQNPLNWCHVCKQVPLFQILSWEELKAQYKCSIEIYDEIDNSVLKIENFKDGVKIV